MVKFYEMLILAPLSKDDDNTDNSVIALYNTKFLGWYKIAVVSKIHFQEDISDKRNFMSIEIILLNCAWKRTANYAKKISIF